MLRVAIIGCGKIADDHAECILQTQGCEIVGVCDREELMAKQLKERLNVFAHFSDVDDLLTQAKPDVVHITTPPQTHYALGLRCLNAGCHIYVEKPFTVTLEEGKDLISQARRRGLKVTVGHNAQFSHAASRVRNLVAAGYLGGPPLHLESYYCYDLGGAGYARSLLGDRDHWVRRLPGGLLQNTISHGVSKIAEYLTNEVPEVIASGFTSPLLRSAGERKIVDELRVLIRDDTTTAYFTFSSQMRPALHELRLYGPQNGVILDENQQTVIKVRGARYKSYLEQFVPPCGYAKQYVWNSLGNMKKFLKAEFHAGYGMKVLIQSFYRSIVDDAPVPIPYDEILRTSAIMDEIFCQLNRAQGAVTLGHRKTALDNQEAGAKI